MHLADANIKVAYKTFMYEQQPVECQQGPADASVTRTGGPHELAAAAPDHFSGQLRSHTPMTAVGASNTVCFP